MLVSTGGTPGEVGGIYQEREVDPIHSSFKCGGGVVYYNYADTAHCYCSKSPEQEVFSIIVCIPECFGLLGAMIILCTI